jgi:small subunit ribosomal protein S24e
MIIYHIKINFRNIYIVCFRQYISLSLEVVLLEDNNNVLLKRREIKSVIKNALGSVKRQDAVELIANKLKLNKNNVLPVTIKSEFGNPDILTLMYYYDNMEEAKKQIPRYLFLRALLKDERKKIIDEEKAIKLKAKQAAIAEAKSKKK